MKMRTDIGIILQLILLLGFLVEGPAGPVMPAAAADMRVFSDSLGPKWQLGGWNATSVVQSGLFPSGTPTVKATEKAAWSAFAFERRKANWSAIYPIGPGEFAAIEFDMNAGSKVPAGLKSLQLYLDNTSAGRTIENYVVGGFKANTWHHLKIPIRDVNCANLPFYRLAFFNHSPTSGFSFYLDHVTLTAASTTTPSATGWLSTSANRLVRSDGSPWMGRGANLHDTRGCGAFTTDAGAPLQDGPTGVAEVKRRIDELTGPWKGNFIRLVLESRRTRDNYVSNATYRGAIQEIVNYIGTRPGVYVLVSIWLDPSLDARGWPTTATNQILDALATDFYNSPHVLFGVSNEPQANYDGAQDAQVWIRMNAAVNAIRTAEARLGPNRHIITVQGTRNWARDLTYYTSHPITAGGGVNIAYETHIYNNPVDFPAMLAPANVLPVIIGEFGPVNEEWAQASVADMQTLIDMATTAGIPYLAWTFHQYCPPNLIGDRPGLTWDANTTTTDGLGMPLYPTDFGVRLRRNLQSAP
ncbi:MAG: cellulase family glycosylhydrolase [Acidobacteria bacterium]|nr:cellulase family glycosylhydrolase [Acidobacteriota bacterium]